MRINSTTLAAFGATIAMAGSGLAHAQDRGSTNQAAVDAGDIIVTATRQGETTLQKTPLAISAFSADQLDKSFISNVRDLAQYTPNLSISQVTANAAIYIRGIGTNAVFNGSDADVAVQIDGVYMARAFSQFTDFVDLDRIEVLRGPQGTLYGRNAVGGVVNIISRKPGNELEGKVQLTTGNYGLVQAQGYVSGPIAPGLSASISGNYIRHNGFQNNIVPGAKDTGTANRGSVRVQLRWQPNDTLEAITRADYSKFDELPQAYDSIRSPPSYSSPLALSTIGKYHTVAQNDRQTLNQELKGISQEINVKLANDWNVKSLTAYRRSAYTMYVDTDATEITANNARVADHAQQFSQEFNLTGNIAFVDFVAGLYYFREKQRNSNQSAVPPSLRTPTANALLIQTLSLSHASSRAAFAQATVHATDTLSLIFGARYTRDTKRTEATANRYRYASPPILGPQIPGFPCQRRRKSRPLGGAKPGHLIRVLASAGRA